MAYASLSVRPIGPLFSRRGLSCFPSKVLSPLAAAACSIRSGMTLCRHPFSAECGVDCSKASMGYDGSERSLKLLGWPPSVPATASLHQTSPRSPICPSSLVSTSNSLVYLWYQDQRQPHHGSQPSREAMGNGHRENRRSCRLQGDPG